MRCRFLVSQETECLTAARGERWGTPRTPAGVARFLACLAKYAPSLPGLGGLFNSYGRVYHDSGHLEFAAAECDSPYHLALVMEQQDRLAARTLEKLRGEGLDLILANVNYNGLLQPMAATWGAHENYLVGSRPEQFAPHILPFLATRIYAGAGAVLFPSGLFLAGSRVPLLDRDTGGGTTDARALHSTARNEHLADVRYNCYRYHLILGDGNRSQFSQALKCGTTMLVLQAISARPSCVVPLPGTPSPVKGVRAFWMQAVNRFNTLCPPGTPPQASRTALRIQRLYLDATRRWAERQRELPGWVPRLLEDWEQTLQALASNDRDWLSRRLDPWIKYELFTAALNEWGHSWSDVPRVPGIMERLALLNQDYHEFCNPDSVFDRLDKGALLDHRVGEPIPPGSEPEPFVPETTTRAAARARFIRRHHGKDHLEMDWDRVDDRRRAQTRSLADPFAGRFGRWQSVTHRPRPSWELWQRFTGCFVR